MYNAKLSNNLTFTKKYKLTFKLIIFLKVDKSLINGDMLAVYYSVYKGTCVMDFQDDTSCIFQVD